MKNTVFALLVGLVFFSCSSDDSGNTFSEAQIIGKWNLLGMTVDGGAFEDYNHDCLTEKDFQQFFSNHELSFNGYNSDCELTENEISLWALKGNKLIVSNTHFDPMVYTYYFTVVKLTSDELVLEQKGENSTERIYLEK